MKKINDKWIRIGGIGVLLINLFLTDFSGPSRTPRVEIIYVLLYLFLGMVVLETGRKIILSMHNSFPVSSQTKVRFCKTAVYVFIANAVLIPFTFNVFHWLRGMHAGNQTIFFVFTTLGGLILSLIQTGVYESIYNFNRIRKLEQEKEELLRLNLQSQFDSLKQQINPHFLFNSINTVSSLIPVDPAKARKFLAEMSKVYRYLLRANEEDLVTLEKELQFLQSYFHLLKTRFGSGLDLQLDIDEASKTLFLPVLSLQLLVENAVKHNTVDVSKPLTLTIETKGDRIFIVNNLQKKLNVVESNKIGLSTIIARYKLLNEDEPVIEEKVTEFIVILPLIQNKPVYESIDS